MKAEKQNPIDREYVFTIPTIIISYYIKIISLIVNNSSQVNPG